MSISVRIRLSVQVLTAALLIKILAYRLVFLYFLRKNLLSFSPLLTALPVLPDLDNNVQGIATVGLGNSEVPSSGMNGYVGSS